MEDRSLPWDAFEGDDSYEIPSKPPEKASSSCGDRKMDGDRRYAMLLQENTDLKKEKKRLEAEKFQLVLDCDDVKVEFQQFVNNIHPLRDCHPGPDVGEPLMPYEIAAFKRDPVKFADLNPELRERPLRETKWRIEDAKLRRHALKFLQDKREDRNKGPEFEPEARKLAEKMIRSSFEAHKDLVLSRDEPKLLPNTPVIASCTLPLESGEAHFTITLTDDVRAVERGFEEVTIEREKIDVVMEEDGQYNEVESAGEGLEDEDAALFGLQEDPSRRQVQTGRFSYGAQTETLSRDQEFGLVGNHSKMGRPRAQTDGSLRSAMMLEGVRGRPAKPTSAVMKGDESTEGLSSSRDSSLETVTSKIGRGDARGAKTGRGGSRGREARGEEVKSFQMIEIRGRPRGRGPSRGGAQRNNTKDIGFNLPDYIRKSVEEYDHSTAPKRARFGTTTTVNLAYVTHSPIDAHFGDPQVRYREAGPETRASTMYKSLQSTHKSELIFAQTKPKQSRKRRHLTSIQRSQGSASVELMNQVTSAQQSKESTSETMGNVKEEAAGNGK